MTELAAHRSAVLEQLPCHIAVLDADGQIILVNRAWRRFAADNGMAETIDWTAFNYFEVCRRASGSDAAEVLGGLEAIVAGRATQFEFQYACHAPTKHRRWFKLIATPFLVDGRRHVIAQHHAITDRRLLEIELSQTQKMEALGRLTSSVAHDFNNLLLGISAAAKIALDQVELDSPAHYYLDQIRSAAVGGTGLTKQLLAFGRKTELELVAQELDEVIAANEGMLRQLVGRLVELEVCCGCPRGAVLCGEGQLVQVVINLVVNAGDAISERGTVTLMTAAIEHESGARAGVELEPGEYCLLTVRDTGVGMDVETQARIFEPFFTTKAVGEGTGLGLSTVRAIVRDAGGQIAVTSEPGRGTCVEVYLPRHRGGAGA